MIVLETAVIPAPSFIETGDGAAFALSTDVQIAGDPDAAAALSPLIQVRTGLTLRVVPPGDSAEPGAIELRVTPGRPAESYRITASATSVVLEGADAAGLFYAVQSLGQLIRREGGDWSIPAVEIADAPRFAYRGVMLDVARHFFCVDTVRGFIDRAASLKLNVLHLHLTDDQGWRIHLDSRPKLTELGSATATGGGDGGFYTKAEFAQIVAHAASRHMTVVPEIDVPGHTHTVGLAYPELAEAPVLSDHILEIVRDYGGELPRAGTPYDGLAVGFSSLKIHDGAGHDNEPTYDFLADVFGELTAMTPGPYIHVGGDEALGTVAADFADFMARVTEIVADLGKIPITWHEAGAAADIADDTIGQYWGFVTPIDGMDEKARAFVRNGSRVILSPADAVYLDMKYDESTPLGLTWANGPTSVERAYSWEPASIIEGIGEHDILGVEAPLWSETTWTATDIDSMAFPRIAAAAEIAWSPAAGPQRTWESFRHRVGTLAPLWTRSGIHFHPSAEIPWVIE